MASHRFAPRKSGMICALLKMSPKSIALLASHLNPTAPISQARNIYRFRNSFLEPVRQPVEYLARTRQPPTQRVEIFHFFRQQRDAEQQHPDVAQKNNH